MPLSSALPSRSNDLAPALDPHTAWCQRAPGWVRRLAESADDRSTAADGALPVTLARSGDAVIAVTGARGMRHCADGELEAAAAAAYSSVLSALAGHGLHAWRFWNFVPGLLDQATAHTGLNRYMVFNAGRAAGYLASFSADALPQAIATASGVGTTGDALLVGCLAGAAQGVPIENPRQVPAYRYSPKFGPRAPFFARATLVGARLLLGGTAAIAGEECVAPGDLEGQLAETVRNIEALIATAADLRGAAAGSVPLDALSSLRAYVVDPRWSAGVRAGLAALGVRCPIELAEADLCRPELLVEVEGTADLPTCTQD